MKRMWRFAPSLLSDRSRLRILEARFCPSSRPASSGPVLIARVYCDGDAASVEPVASALEGSLPVERLRAIVEKAGPNPYAELVAFRGAEWSFAETGGARA